MSKKLDSFLWIEKYRPQSISDIILPKSRKSYFTKLINSGEIPNILLSSSSAGTGKTTTAKAICNDIGCDYIYINASEKTGIDTLRDDIKKFAVTKSFNGKPKIVILDEIDSNSNINLQKALRGFMEEFHKSCRFILTCNFINNVIKPLQSRCEVIDYNMMETEIVEEMKPKIIKRLKGILKFEGVQYTENVVEKIVDIYYPDVRFMIKIMDQFQKTYDEINENIFSVDMMDDEFYEFILNGKMKEIREYITQRNLNYDELYTNIYNNVVPKIAGKSKGEAILIINEGQKWNNQVANKQINFLATMYELIRDCVINNESKK